MNESYYRQVALVEDSSGEVCVSGCCNCPFLHESMGAHCVLRPKLKITDFPPQIPDDCPLIGPGVLVRFDANRQDFLAHQGEPGVAERRYIDPQVREKLKELRNED